METAEATEAANANRATRNKPIFHGIQYTNETRGDIFTQHPLY